MGQFLVRAIPDSILPPGHLYERHEGKREALKKGELLPAGNDPPICYFFLILCIALIPPSLTIHSLYTPVHPQVHRFTSDS